MNSSFTIERGTYDYPVWLTISWSALVLAKAFVTSFTHKIATNDYEELLDPVAFSSRMIAAERAYESELPDALFRDPLAFVLAGDAAMQRVRKRKEQLQVPLRAGEMRALNNVTARTKYLNELILSCISARATHAHFEPLLSSCGSVKPIKQVVLLGAGMDTRAWFLRLGEDVSWFEVDQERVVQAKLSALNKVGVQVDATQAATAPSASFTTKLTCGQYHAIGADLLDSSWVQKLVASGLQTYEPVLWILEGLTYYLPGEVVRQLYCSAAEASAVGSVIAATMIPAESAERIRSSKHDIMGNFIWGYPSDIQGMVEGWGWRYHNSPDYESIAALWGHPYKGLLRRRQAGVTSTPKTEDAPSLTDGYDQPNGSRTSGATVLVAYKAPYKAA